MLVEQEIDNLSDDQWDKVTLTDLGIMPFNHAQLEEFKNLSIDLDNLSNEDKKEVLVKLEKILDEHFYFNKTFINNKKAQVDYVNETDLTKLRNDLLDTYMNNYINAYLKYIYLHPTNIEDFQYEIIQNYNFSSSKEDIDSYIEFIKYSLFSSKEIFPCENYNLITRTNLNREKIIKKAIDNLNKKDFELLKKDKSILSLLSSRGFYLLSREEKVKLMVHVYRLLNNKVVKEDFLEYKKQEFDSLLNNDDLNFSLLSTIVCSLVSEGKYCSNEDDALILKDKIIDCYKTILSYESNKTWANNLINSYNNDILAILKLGEVGILAFNNNQNIEINLALNKLSFLTSHDKLSTNRLAKLRKNTIKDFFDLLMEHLNLTDINLKFEKDAFNFDEIDEDRVIYFLDPLDEDPSTLLVNLSKECIEFYIKNIYKNPDKIGKEKYKLLRLISLTDKEEILDTYLNYYSNLLYGSTLIDLSKFKVDDNLLNIDINQLYQEYLTYNLNSASELEKLDSNNISLKNIRKVFSLFSNSIFKDLDLNTKLNLVNVVFQYFNYTNIDNKELMDKIDDSTTNIEALELIMRQLVNRKESSSLLEIKKADQLNDFKSGFKYIIKNEVNKEEIKDLNNLSIKKINKR